MVPAIPLDEELAGVELDNTKLAANILELTVLSDGVPEGSLRTNILSEEATLAAVGNVEAFIPVLAMIIQE
jgi:hypothetical protein